MSTRSGNLVDSIRRSIVRRVSLSIIVTVLAIGTVAMAAIICWHYQRQYDDFESSTSNVTNAYSSAIAGAMWHLDTSQLNLLADGIQQQESVSYVRINDRGALKHRARHSPLSSRYPNQRPALQRYAHWSIRNSFQS